MKDVKINQLSDETVRFHAEKLRKEREEKERLERLAKGIEEDKLGCQICKCSDCVKGELENGYENCKNCECHSCEDGESHHDTFNNEDPENEEDSDIDVDPEYNEDHVIDSGKTKHTADKHESVLA